MPFASVTVEFNTPISGARLIEAVKALADNNEHSETGFASERSYDNGDCFIVGQRSMETIYQLIVAASHDEQRIRPDGSYESCIVQNHTWPYPYYPLGYGDYEGYVIENVRKFASSLERLIAGGDSDTEKVWPQSVNVCALCHKILWRSFDEEYNCPTHGKNPPVHSQPVRPA